MVFGYDAGCIDFSTRELDSSPNGIVKKRTWPKRQRSYSGLAALGRATLVGGSLSNGNGPRNRSSNCQPAVQVPALPLPAGGAVHSVHQHLKDRVVVPLQSSCRFYVSGLLETQPWLRTSISLSAPRSRKLFQEQMQASV
ncbi:hypothetical protein J4Q44_G00085600 [Coregonus suidteri]|uniref:Uncharacterized protein n=1 Tax=Coregonus suidteri TaxID=861788 RepID=A0AAN8M3B0_9TELE